MIGTLTPLPRSQRAIAAYDGDSRDAILAEIAAEIAQFGRQDDGADRPQTTHAARDSTRTAAAETAPATSIASSLRTPASFFAVRDGTSFGILSTDQVEPRWDVFISYAREDLEFATSLAHELVDVGLSVWFDQFALEAGDSLRRSIDMGLRDSRYGIVILSPHFFTKRWPQRELDGLTAREDGHGKVILPIWYNVSEDAVRNYSPPLADKVSILYAGSVHRVVDKLLRAIHKDRLREFGGKSTMVKSRGDVDLVVLPIRPNKGFALCMGRFPVTNEQYKLFVDSTGHEPPTGKRHTGDSWSGPFDPWKDPEYLGSTKPVVCVDIWDALDYCKWARSGDIHVFLPPSDLWDLVAQEFNPTNDLVTTMRRMPLEQTHQRTDIIAPIALDGRRDSTLGISDLFGNVWEWCAESPGHWHPGYHEHLDRLKYGPRLTDGQFRYAAPQAELRGGSFLDDLQTINPALRSDLLEDGVSTRHSDLGFRVAALTRVDNLSQGVVETMQSYRGLNEELWSSILQIERYYDWHKSLRKEELEVHALIRRLLESG